MLRAESRLPVLKWAGLMGVITLAACGLAGNEPEPGLYRAVIEAPEGEIPFGLELGAPATGGDSQAPALFLLEGESRIAFDNVARVEKALEARLPGGKATLTFTARGQRLSGYLRLPNNAGATDEFTFTAESGVVYRFFRESSTDNADVAGRWSASFSNGAGNADWV
ncbi:MAG: hypothetical protein RLZZ403_1252, partial [Pseudomonadota bacterium]